MSFWLQENDLYVGKDHFSSGYKPYGTFKDTGSIRHQHDRAQSL